MPCTNDGGAVSGHRKLPGAAPKHHGRACIKTGLTPTHWSVIETWKCKKYINENIHSLKCPIYTLWFKQLQPHQSFRINIRKRNAWGHSLQHNSETQFASPLPPTWCVVGEERVLHPCGTGRCSQREQQDRRHLGQFLPLRLLATVDGIFRWYQHLM